MTIQRECVSIMAAVERFGECSPEVAEKVIGMAASYVKELKPKKVKKDRVSPGTYKAIAHKHKFTGEDRLFFQKHDASVYKALRNQGVSRYKAQAEARSVYKIVRPDGPWIETRYASLGSVIFMLTNTKVFTSDEDVIWQGEKIEFLTTHAMT